MTITARLYVNGDDCFLAWHMPPSDGCWGFALHRSLRTAAGKEFSGFVKNRTGFAGDKVVPNERRSSVEWPFQRYTWTDHGVSEGDEVTYTITPVVRANGGLHVDEAQSVTVGPARIDSSNGEGVSAYFNRGLILSQFVARALGPDWQKSDVAQLKEALRDRENELRAFLTGQLGQQILALLEQARAEGWHVYAALYELDDDALIEAMRLLGDRAHVVLANGSKKKKGEDGNAHAAEVLDGVVDLTRRMLWSKGLGHNKFVVFARDEAEPFLVWTGSMNWASTGMCTQINNAILIEDPDVARVYFDQWKPFLVAGTDLSVNGQGLVENIRIVQTQGPNINTGAPVVPGAFPLFTQNQSIPDSNQVDPGLFVQGRLPVTDDLTLRGGGRLDWVHSSSNPRLITGNLDLFGTAASPGSAVNRFVLDPAVYSVDASNPNLTRDYTLLSGFLRGEYKLDPNWTAMAAVGHAERAPTLTELYAAGPFIGVLQQGTSRLIGDPNLSPEKLTQFDVGVRADYEFLQFGANAFFAAVKDYITYDLNKAGSGLIQVVYTNTDLATLTGGELFAQADLTAWLTPFATLSYVQGIDQTARDHRRPAGLASSRRDDPLAGVRKAATEPLPQIPPLESRLGFRLHAPARSPWWQVEFSVRMVAGQNNVATSLDELPTPGFTTLTVRGFVRLRDRWLLTAGVENLGDKNYREHLDPISGNLLGVGPLFRPGTNFFFGAQATY